MSASAIIQPLPQHATFAQRQEYRRVVLNLPGPVDRWLTTNSRSPRIDFLQDYLMLEDVRVEYVDCVVESVCVKSRYSCQYTLYITASVSFRSRRLFLRTSPQAILEQFFGSSEAIDAPEWTRWGKPTLEFQQPKATFAALFLRMADWTENQNQLRLPYMMTQWAHSIMFETAAAANSHHPLTPIPKNVQTARNSRAHKPRAHGGSNDQNGDKPPVVAPMLMRSPVIEKLE